MNCCIMTVFFDDGATSIFYMTCKLKRISTSSEVPGNADYRLRKVPIQQYVGDGGQFDVHCARGQKEVSRRCWYSIRKLASEV